MSRWVSPASGVLFDGGEGDAVEADLDLGDLGDAVGGAELGFRRLHPARGILDVREALADAGAEQLHAGAGAGRFDDRRAERADWRGRLARRPPWRTDRRSRSRPRAMMRASAMAGMLSMVSAVAAVVKILMVIGQTPGAEEAWFRPTISP